MKEFKSRKTGRVSVYTDEEYDTMVRAGFDMRRYVITDVKMRNIIPAKPPEISTKKKKV